MRKLNTADVFAAARVIRASGMKTELQALVKRAASSDSPVGDIGIEGFLTIMEALAERKSEQAIYELMAGPLEMDAQAVATLPLDELAKMLQEISKEMDLKRFFSYVSGMIGKS